MIAKRTAASRSLPTDPEPASPPTGTAAPGEVPGPDRPTRLLSLLDGFSRLAGPLLLVVGVASLVVSMLPATWGRSSREPVWILAPLAALGFLAAGLSLWLSRPPRQGPGSRLAARVLALFVLMVGLSALLVRLSGIESQASGAGEALAPLQLAWGAARAVSLNSIFSLVMAGCALWLTNARGPWRQGPAQLFALGSMLLALLALVNITYSHNRHELAVFAEIITTGFFSASCSMILAIGILGVRPDRGLMAVVTAPGPGGVMARRLLPACVLVPLLLGWIGITGERQDLYRSSTGYSLLVVANIVVVIGLIWVNSGLIDRMEARQRATRDALRESEVFYHSLVENLPQNILRKNRDGQFTFVNRRFAETVGRDASEIVGLTDADLFPAALAEKYRADDHRVMDEAGPFEVVEEHITPDGQTHYVQVIKTPLRDTAGSIIGVQGIFWDVTDRWRYETRLREQNEQLAAMADSERCAHEELKKAQSRMVQTAKLAGLGEMVAGVAHEINNPLSFVSNNVAVLQRDLDELRTLLRMYEQAEQIVGTVAPEALADIQRFRQEADVEYTIGNLDGLLTRTRDGLKRIQRIVGDLRVFARLDEGDLNAVDLNAGIESTIGIVLGNAKKKQIEIERDLAPLPPVDCFGTKINQVIMNLISNSIDACDEGGTIRIVSRPEPAGVRIEVRDDGCGIPPEVKEKIFDPFFTTKPVGVGTGLGLSISYGILQDHGGTIEVDSPPGGGACFTVWLPYHVPAPRPSHDEAGAQPRRSGAGAAYPNDPWESHA